MAALAVQMRDVAVAFAGAGEEGDEVPPVQGLDEGRGVALREGPRLAEHESAFDPVEGDGFGGAPPAGAIRGSSSTREKAPFLIFYGSAWIALLGSREDASDRTVELQGACSC